MRVKAVDDYMEQKFGKPDWSKSFWGDDGLRYTPLKGNPNIFRVDTRDDIRKTRDDLRKSEREMQKV